MIPLTRPEFRFRAQYSSEVYRRNRRVTGISFRRKGRVNAISHHLGGRAHVDHERVERRVLRYEREFWGSHGPCRPLDTLLNRNIAFVNYAVVTFRSRSHAGYIEKSQRDESRFSIKILKKSSIENSIGRAFALFHFAVMKPPSEMLHRSGSRSGNHTHKEGDGKITFQSNKHS